MFYYRPQDNRNVLDRCFVREARKLMKPKILKSGKETHATLETWNIECRQNERVTHRREKNANARFSMLRAEKRENSRLGSAGNRGKQGGGERGEGAEEHGGGGGQRTGARERKCEALARPARFHGFVTFRVATRGLLTPFDCPSKRIRARRGSEAHRGPTMLFFSITDVVVV